MRTPLDTARSEMETAAVEYEDAFSRAVQEINNPEWTARMADKKMVLISKSLAFARAKKVSTS